MYNSGGCGPAAGAVPGQAGADWLRQYCMQAMSVERVTLYECRKVLIRRSKEVRLCCHGITVIAATCRCTVKPPSLMLIAGGECRPQHCMWADSKCLMAVLVLHPQQLEKACLFPQPDTAIVTDMKRLQHGCRGY